MKFTVVVAYTLSVDWLRKSRVERTRFNEQHIAPIINKYADVLNMRFFDAECFETRFTDFMIVETESLKSYYFMFEELRDSAIVTDGYLSFDKIFIGIEDGHKQYEQKANQRV